MNWLYRLHSALMDLDNYDPKHLLAFIDLHRISLDRLLHEDEGSLDAMEILSSVSYGLAYSDRYDEAIPYALAVLNRVDPESDGNGNLAMRRALNALIWALFQKGRLLEASKKLKLYEQIDPKDEWLKNMRDMIQVLQSKHIAKGAMYIAGVIMVLQWLFKLSLNKGNLIISLIGLILFVASLMIDRWSKRRLRILSDRVNGNGSSLRVV